MEIKPEDIVVSTFDADPHSGGYRLNRLTGVRIVHGPSGIATECSVERSEWRNRAKAMERLQIKVDKWEIEQYEISKTLPIPKGVDLDQTKRDFNNGVIICRSTWASVLYNAIAMEKELKQLKGKI
jgi:hypothetical protein